MQVWIVIRNDKVDSVFDNEQAANEHAKNLMKKWAITKIITKTVQSI